MGGLFESELRGLRLKPLEKRGSVTLKSETYGKILDEVFSKLVKIFADPGGEAIDLSFGKQAPAADGKKKFKVGDGCRMRAGGARCNITGRMGDGSAFCAADMLEPA